MKQIISASRRTDIPAFYLRWFMERIKEGFVDVRNPFYPQNVKRVPLTADQVEWIVFWSRNYGHFLKHRHFFEAYRLFFHFTILSPSMLEKSPMPLKRQLAQLEQLVKFYGAQHIVWRYDPLVFWKEGEQIKTNFNEKEFACLADKIGALGIRTCTISVAHPYAKFKKRLGQKFPALELVDDQHEMISATVRTLVSIAREAGLQIKACCTDSLLDIEGVTKATCIDGRLLNLLGSHRVSQAKAPTRPQCACTRSIDIGDYRRQPCYFGCLYCYANPLWK